MVTRVEVERAAGHGTRGRVRYAFVEKELGEATARKRAGNPDGAHAKPLLRFCGANQIVDLHSSDSERLRGGRADFP